MLKISVQALLCPKSYQGQAKANSMGAYHQDDFRDASRSPHVCQPHFKKSHCFVTHWGHPSAWVIFFIHKGGLWLWLVLGNLVPLITVLIYLTLLIMQLQKDIKSQIMNKNTKTLK